MPKYRELFEKGILKNRLVELYDKLKACDLCPRKCAVNRYIGELGYCRAGADMVVSSAFPHFGEESPLVGNYGSGTIFMSHCNLRCVFCQNYELSHKGEGQIVSPAEVAKMMMSLSRYGCHNINFVTPTHFVPQIVEAISIAIEMGFDLPLVYNCGGYESIAILKLLEGVFDIYMPDIKFADSKWSSRYCNAADYFEVCRGVLKEMFRQVGDLFLSNEGIAVRGLLIRHLVMPNGIAGSRKVLEFIAKEISPQSYVNIMAQYRPCYDAYKYTELSRRVTTQELEEVYQIAQKEGLRRGFADVL